MTFQEFEELASKHTAIPVSRKAMADVLTPVLVFLKLRQDARNPFLFESVEGGEHLARYSFLGSNPFQVLSMQAEVPVLQDFRNGEVRKFPGVPFYDVLKLLTTAHKEAQVAGLPRLTGGAVGYSSYDTIRYTENLPNPPEDHLGLPEAVWSFYDEIYAFDHVKHQIIMMKTVFIDELTDLRSAWEHATLALDRMDSVLKRSTPMGDFRLDVSELVSNTSPDRFYDMVKTAKNYIYEGDIFQVVLSQRFAQKFTGDRFMLYRALRMVNPSPYLFYMDYGGYALIGSSPEVLVRVQDRTAEVLPIAGTRPRGSTPEEDAAYEKDLLADPKEIAEHIMLVDLGRNDLSRICTAGTVKVMRSQAIERYSHVMHIVSDVEGRLAEESTSVDAIVHCFPAGTVSGAPKVRAMEIIDELEVSRRGPYAGAVGYFDYSGNMDTCIAIRTMVATEESVYIQAGAGIVADSVPENEYMETVNKARALVEALSVALQVNELT
jgi:anthranilate synthase component I